MPPLEYISQLSVKLVAENEMSVVQQQMPHTTKRSNSVLNGRQGSAEPVGTTSNKRHEVEGGAKPGRKPLQSEPKNKRTAQNRLLQRLFRERKERRMKELEDKVASLEDEKLQLHNESEFLRLQVETLMSELKKFRGDKDISTLLPKLVPALSSSSASSLRNSDFSNASESGTPSSTNSPVTKKENAYEFPWQSMGKQPYHAHTAISSESSISGSSGLDKSESGTPRLFTANPGLSSGGANDSISSNSSSVSTAYSPNELRDLGITPNENSFPLFGHSLRRSSILSNGANNNDDLFDEKLNDFCLKLSEACGSKSCPVPKKLASNKATSAVTTGGPNSIFTEESNFKVASSPFNFNDDTLLSPFNQLINEQLQQQPQQTAQVKEEQQDPFSFLDQAPFDPSIAFDINDFGDFLDEEKPQNNLGNLVTEESMYDPLGMYSQSNDSQQVMSPLSKNLSPPSMGEYDSNAAAFSGNLGNPVKNEFDEEFDENVVVPSNDGKLLKCGAIWDRITKHPRYTDIDIDGLCLELKQKLKCSERGAVVDAKDVYKLLDDNYLIKN